MNKNLVWMGKLLGENIYFETDDTPKGNQKGKIAQKLLQEFIDWKEQEREKITKKEIKKL